MFPIAGEVQGALRMMESAVSTRMPSAPRSIQKRMNPRISRHRAGTAG